MFSGCFKIYDAKIILIVLIGYRPQVERVPWHSHPESADHLINSGSRRASMKLRPLQDSVLIRRVEPEAKSAGGIFIPDTAKEKPMEGEIVAVGPGTRDEAGKLHPLDVKAGDRVLFGKWSGTEVKLDGEELMIMKESDIMGVVDQAVATKK